jgi:methylated-DNA-[protein]-cysteine S-methyltransferase
MTRYTEMESSIGTLVLAGDAEGARLRGLRLIWLPGGRGKFRPEPDWVKDAKPFAETIRQLREYFAGKRDAFDLPLAPEGTEFQQEVWRAVGAANGQNPLPIVIPCHRVIGSDGRLTGYGGGLPLKKRLLELESRQRVLL